MKTKTKKISRKFLWFVLALLVVIIAGRLYFRLTDDFRLANMTYELPYHKEWEIQPLDPEENEQLEAVLAQKFYYIGKGAQSYAFSSEDNKYVLKFFKFKHLKPHWFVELFPPIPPFSDYRNKQAVRKQKKLDGVFAGYRLAYDVHRGDSGLLFIHLNKTHDLHKSVIVYDKIGLQREIDLDSVVFLVQEKAKTTRSVVDDALKSGDLALAKQRIRQIFDLYMSEYNKGIFDKDHGVMHNTGFVGDRPIHLDVGKLTKNDAMKYPEEAQKDLTLISRKFNTWISANYPKEAPEIAKDMNEKIKEIFGSLEAGRQQGT